MSTSLQVSLAEVKGVKAYLKSICCRDEVVNLGWNVFIETLD